MLGEKERRGLDLSEGNGARQGAAAQGADIM
jgi:peptide/nickel transport system ATP-binding protein